MTELSVAGRQLPLVFDLCSWAQIEEEVCRLQDMHLLLGRGKKTEDAQSGLKEKLDSSSIINLSHPDYDRLRDLLVTDIMALFPVPESDMKSKRLSTLIKLVRILGNEGLGRQVARQSRDGFPESHAGSLPLQQRRWRHLHRRKAHHI